MVITGSSDPDRAPPRGRPGRQRLFTKPYSAGRVREELELLLTPGESGAIMTRFRYSVFLAVLSAGALRAQCSPELREILDRLQKLEEANRDLVQEVHALRQELASTHNPASAAPAPTNADAAEQMAVDKARVDELAQTKVESSQKLPLRSPAWPCSTPTSTDATTVARRTPPSPRSPPAMRPAAARCARAFSAWPMTARRRCSARRSADALNLDFFGGSRRFAGSPAAIAHRHHLARLEPTPAFCSVRTSPSFRRAIPTSFAQVGVSPLTGAGNLWLWQPQMRAGAALQLRRQLRAARAGGRRPDARAGRRSQRIQRPMFRRPSPDAAGGARRARRRRPLRVVAAVGRHRTHRNRPRLSRQCAAASDRSSFRHHVSIRSTGCRARSSHLELSGFFYNGQNVADLGALPQGMRVSWLLPGPRRAQHRRVGAASHPGHPAAGVRLLRRQQDDRKSDLARGYIGMNAGYFANVDVPHRPQRDREPGGRAGPDQYLSAGNRLNNHYDLAVAYLVLMMRLGLRWRCV